MGVGGWEARVARGWRLISKKPRQLFLWVFQPLERQRKNSDQLKRVELLGRTVGAD